MGNENHVSIGNADGPDHDGKLDKSSNDNANMVGNAGAAAEDMPDKNRASISRKNLEPEVEDKENRASISQKNLEPEIEDKEVASEDIDVDILYMRLKALQSMKEKLDQEDDEMVEEMEELLQEADQAANEINEIIEDSDDYSDYVPTSPLPMQINDVDEAGLDLMMRTSLSENTSGGSISGFDGVISGSVVPTVDNCNDDKMSNVVKRLREVARKTIADLRKAETTGTDVGGEPIIHEVIEENYSPTQSPIRDVTDDEGFEVIDIDLIDVDRASSPIDDEEPIIVFAKPKPVPEVIDLEPAEVNFFKQQREEPLFPASVWEFHPTAQKAPAASTKNEVITIEASNPAHHEDNLEAFHMAVMAQSKTVQKFRRKRARSRGKSQSVSEERETLSKVEDNLHRPPPIKSARKNLEENLQEDEEKALRAAVLSSMAVKRTKKIEIEENKKKISAEKLQEIDLGKSAPSSPSLPPPSKAESPNPSIPLNAPGPNITPLPLTTPIPPVTSSPSTADIIKSTKKIEKPLTKIATKVNRVKKLTAAEKKKQLEVKKGLILKKAKAERDLKKLKEELVKYQDKTIKNKMKVMPLSRKHFPNLFMRKVIITSTDLVDSDTEGGETKTVKASSVQFEKNLDDLMKNLRSQSKQAEVKAVPPPKPARKFPPKQSIGTSVSAKGSGKVEPKETPKTLKRSLSSKDKEILKKSNISHLPPDKQMEYKKLLVLLAQREKAKKANNSKTLTVSISKDSPHRTVKSKLPNQSTQVSKATMATKAGSSNLAPPTATNSNISVKKTLISNPNSKKNEKKPDPFSSNTLADKESELVKSRKEMCASLFKLSAEVSQLKEETSKKETAEAFLEQLQKQVAVTSELITRKNERLNTLKTVVRQSHQEVVTKSRSMSILKKECKSMGTILKGNAYQPPQEGMDTIRKKLSVINNSAKNVTNNSTNSTNRQNQNNLANNQANSIKVEPAAVPKKPDVQPVTKAEKGKSEKTQKKEESESDSSSDDSDDDESDSDESNSDTSSSDSDSSDDNNDDATTEKVRENGIEQQKRPSSLAHLSRSSVVLDPQVELCRFDLQGRCNDKTCPYQHLRPTTSPPPPTPSSPPKLR